MSQEVEMSSIPKEADVAPQTTPEAIVSIPPPETKPEEEAAREAQLVYAIPEALVH